MFEDIDIAQQEDQLAIADRKVRVRVKEEPPPTEDAVEDDRGSRGREVRPRISE